MFGASHAMRADAIGRQPVQTVSQPTCATGGHAWSLPAGGAAANSAAAVCWRRTEGFSKDAHAGICARRSRLKLRMAGESGRSRNPRAPSYGS
jgi:hypothetical protein